MQLVAKMVCKFHAAMTSSSYKLLLGSVTVLSLLMAGAPARAERADRLKKMEVESDQPGKVDLQKKVVTFNGNVVVTKGTMSIKASRIEVRENADGYQYAIALGSASAPARFRQKRDDVDEWIEGEADRLEYESKADTVKLIDKAQMRRVRGSEVADEVTGALIVYENTSQIFTVSGGASAATAANPNGRVRAVLAPRAGTAAAAEAAQSPSQPPSQPASAPGSTR